MELIQESEAEGYSVRRLGRAVVVVPFAGELADWQVAKLRRASALLTQRKVAAAARAVGCVQRALGVTQDLHQLATEASAASLTEKVRRARKAARDAERARVAASPPPTDPEPNGSVNFNADEAEKARAKLRTAQVQIARARAAGKRDQGAINARRAALADLRKFESRTQAAREQQRNHAWAEAARAETLALAQARGEEVTLERAEDGRSPARVRVKSRDGLRALWDADALTQEELNWGMAFRERFEAAHASKVASGLAMLGGGRAAGSDAALAVQARNLRLMAELAEIELVVSVGKRGPFRLRVLREIAGEGRCIRDIASGGDGRSRIKTLLLEGLHLVPVGIEAARDRLANQGQ